MMMDHKSSLIMVITAKEEVKSFEGDQKERRGKVREREKKESVILVVGSQELLH
jgi:hypothetical protein